MHTCIHAYMHTRIQAYKRTRIHAYKHTCIHAYMHTCIHAYMHTCIHEYMNTCIHAYMHTCIMHTCIYVYIHKVIHVYLHVTTCHITVDRLNIYTMNMASIMDLHAVTSIYLNLRAAWTCPRHSEKVGCSGGTVGSGPGQNRADRHADLFGVRTRGVHRAVWVIWAWTKHQGGPLGVK